MEAIGMSSECQTDAKRQVTLAHEVLQFLLQREAILVGDPDGKIGILDQETDDRRNSERGVDLFKIIFR